MFAGWSKYPPTNILVKALVEGFGGTTKTTPKPGEEFEIPSEAMAAMQKSAVEAIAAKAGSRIPVMKGKDPGLPKAMPIFDLDAMRQKNADIVRKRATIKVVQNVGD